jgi:dihydroorotase
MQILTITRPDDCHLHLRDGAELASVAADSARRFARAVVMPNLVPPITTVEQAEAYRGRILQALPARAVFEPLMTLYLTERTPAQELRRAAESPHLCAVKLYPAGATTHSDAGVTDIERIYPLLEIMAGCNLPLLVHGEVTDADVDVFDREVVFIERVLVPIVEHFAGLRIVLEHVTTEQGVRFVESGPATLAATITPHHLLLNRGALFSGGLRPHHYCLPVLKRERDRQALIAAATGGSGRFFLGTDSAPHARTVKESACGCAGIYSAHCAIELYAEVFEDAGALGELENFAGRYGARFYGLDTNRGQMTLQRREWQVPETLPFGGDELVPLRAGGSCRWQLVAA